MVVTGFLAKATHLAVYDAPVVTYEKLSFSIHNFGERWLGSPPVPSPRCRTHHMLGVFGNKGCKSRAIVLL